MSHEKQNKFVGSMRHIPGLKVYEMNTETYRFTEAKMESLAVVKSEVRSDGTHINDVVKSSKIIMKPGHIYCQALNPRNAARKFAKRLGLQKVENGTDDKTNSRD